MATPNLNLDVLSDANKVTTADWNANWAKIDTWAGLFKNRITDSGTSGIWKWYKYEDGTMECFGQTAPANLAVTGNSAPYYVATANAALPPGFIEKPKVFLQSASFGMIGVTHNPTTSTTTNIALIYWDLVSHASDSCSAHIHCLGKWK